MSTLYKAPTINTVIEEMIAAKTVSVDYVDEFLKILNGKYTGSVVSYDTVGTYAQKLPAGTASKINRAFIYFNNPNPVQGMLFQRASGKDSTYWFIALGQPLCQICKLSVDKVVTMSECLSVLEIRETIKQHGGTGGESEWEREIKPYLALNGTKIEVKNKKLFVGTSEQGAENSELQAYNIITNTIGGLSPSTSVNIADDLRVGASGETKKIYLNGVELGGGTKLYKHLLTMDDGDTTYHYTIITNFQNQFYANQTDENKMSVIMPSGINNGLIIKDTSRDLLSHINSDYITLEKIEVYFDNGGSIIGTYEKQQSGYPTPRSFSDTVTEL